MSVLCGTSIYPCFLCSCWNSFYAFPFCIWTKSITMMQTSVQQLYSNPSQLWQPEFFPVWPDWLLTICACACLSAPLCHRKLSISSTSNWGYKIDACRNLFGQWSSVLHLHYTFEWKRYWTDWWWSLLIHLVPLMARTLLRVLRRQTGWRCSAHIPLPMKLWSKDNGEAEDSDSLWSGSIVSRGSVGRHQSHVCFFFLFRSHASKLSDRFWSFLLAAYLLIYQWHV